MSKCNYQGYCEACAGDDRYPHVGKIIVSPTNAPVNHDPVNQPQHYQLFPGVEAIEIIAASLTEEEFRGYALGNALKYRLRAGAKDDLAQDIAKATKYVELFERYKKCCRKV